MRDVIKKQDGSQAECVFANHIGMNVDVSR